MTSTHLRAVLADDLLLDRVGARLECDDELGSLLLAVARRADTPRSRRTPHARPRRHHRGLPVLAALGVAVSGATVAAALEAGPGVPATAESAVHARLLPRTLEALGLPFSVPGLVPGRLLASGGGGPAAGSTAASVPGIDVGGRVVVSTWIPPDSLPSLKEWPQGAPLDPGGSASESGAEQADAAPPAASAAGGPTERPSAPASTLQESGAVVQPDAVGDAVPATTASGTAAGGNAGDSARATGNPGSVSSGNAANKRGTVRTTAVAKTAATASPARQPAAAGTAGTAVVPSEGGQRVLPSTPASLPVQASAGRAGNPGTPSNASTEGGASTGKSGGRQAPGSGDPSTAHAHGGATSDTGSSVV